MRWFGLVVLTLLIVAVQARPAKAPIIGPIGLRPYIEIISPQDMGELGSQDLILRVKVWYFTLTWDRYEVADQEGRGYYQVFVDGNAIASTICSELVISGLSPGRHQILVRLINEDGGYVTPETEDSISVYAPIPEPGLTALENISDVYCLWPRCLGIWDVW